ncbi:MAG TPA: polysaccharide deacetylase family protein [Gemmatimonadales bacterium]|jgi:hypothetical protein|nr:polysaccharide deacetylase family protein [Gemmatimonadales bacterium]
MLKSLASVSFDLDNLWSYQQTHGDAEWRQYRSYLPSLMPPLLECLDRVGCKITFFVVGADAARENNLRELQMIPAHGHEVGNHSFNHECWLHLYTKTQLQEELERAEAAIIAATGQRPTGFRGPGYSWSPTLLEVLAERGYSYDASTLPTYLGPLARLYFLRSTRMPREERERRHALFGSFRNGFRPLRPYEWRLASGRRLLEIPVTTMPVLKLPFHMSYLLFLAGMSERLMYGYLDTALALCRVARLEPSFLLHPLDVLGRDQVPELTFFPGMDVPSARKQQLLARVLEVLAGHYQLVPMGVHARALTEGSRLRSLKPHLTARRETVL